MNAFSRWCFAILFFFYLYPANAQNENNIWYFGNQAGLDFNSGAPVALTNGQLFSNEGCASVSDNAGNLLFYTNGITVWNRLHAVMMNGSGLLGDLSSTQSALIVQDPANANRYYIFTLPPIGGTNGMCYSIVDMTMDSGNGAVTATKNVLLHASSTEKIAGFANCDGSVWVISHEWNSSNFFADLVTTAGISPSVVSSVGSIHTGGSAGANFNAVSYLRMSQQGDRLALAIRDMQRFEVFDFNAVTGVISNPKILQSATYNTPYGVEFSPDGTKLYGSVLGTSAVYQFNITLPTAAAIMGSAVNVAPSATGLHAALQLGPDNKIYSAREFSYTSGPTTLDVINNPNVSGTGCNYVNGAVSLAGRMCLAGLPTAVVIPVVDVHITGPTLTCAGQSVTLTASGANAYIWSGGVNATTTSVTVTPLVTTDYYLSDTCGRDTDTITVTVDSPVAVAVTASDDTICTGQTVNLAATGSTTYQWTGGALSTLPAINVSPAVTTSYYVTGAATGACTADTDTIIVYVASVAPNVQITGTDTICSGQTTTLVATGGNSYAWSGGSTATTDSISVSPTAATTYYVTGTTGCGSDNDTLVVYVQLPVNVTISTADDSLCSGQSTVLTAAGSTLYQWSGGSTATAASINVSPLATTVYYVSGDANACAQNTDTITVYVEAIPAINVAGATSVCVGQSATLTASGGSNYTWSGGSTATTAAITVSPTVTTAYYVTSTSLNCGSDTDTAIVVVDTISVITISGTDTICAGQNAVLTAGGGDTYLWSTTATTASITVAPAATSTYTVTGSNGSCSSVALTFEVVVNALPVVSISGPPYICTGASGTYTAVATGAGSYQYMWSTAATTPAVTITPVAVTTPLSVLVTDLNGCSATSSLTVATVPLPVALATSSGSGCAPLSTSFFSESTNASSFEWNFGDGTTSNQQNPSHVYISSGVYIVTLVTTNIAGCTNTLVLDSVITAYTRPVAGISSTGNLMTDHTQLIVYNNSAGSDDCMLDFGDGTSLAGCNWSDAFHTYTNEGDYTITQIVTTENGCADTAVIHINATYESTFFAPNAITANGNTHNDIFYIYGTGLFGFHLTIYDRWGEQIYDSHDINQGWDGTYKGKPVEEGVYVWKADYETKRLGDQQKIGHVTVIR